MAEKTWLYIYENQQQRKLYIGIAKNMGRVFQGHNLEAEKLRDTSGTIILQTLTPFNSRKDALRAEAVAIHIASFLDAEIIVDNDDNVEDELFHEDDVRRSGSCITNISGVQHTKHLTPAIYVREGEVDWSSLSETVIVPIKPEEVQGKVAAFGGYAGEVFAQRACEFWNVASEKRGKIKRLIAVLRGRKIILGSWEVDQSTDPSSWRRFDESELFDPTEHSPGKGKAISIPLVNPRDDDCGGIKGMTLTGVRLNQGVLYSPDFATTKR